MKPDPGRLLKERAADLGFAITGSASVLPVPGAEAFTSWIERGLHGSMDYLAQRAADRLDPARLLSGARSVFMAAVNYARGEPLSPQLGMGQVARYAWGRDYHNIVGKRLKKLQRFALNELGMETYRCVDSGPLLERQYAAEAGLGWAGRHTLLINPDMGSWLLLGGMIVDRELEPDIPGTDACGSCRLCIDACPTQAISFKRREVDARRCISYLTIESRIASPRDLRAGIGSWIFGCDVCQEVCPHNRNTARSADPAFSPDDRNAVISVESVLSASDDELRARFHATPLARPGPAGLRRNALVVAGNQKVDGLAPLIRMLAGDADPLIRGQAVWALGQMGDMSTVEKLRSDPDAGVREEAEALLSRR